MSYPTFAYTDAFTVTTDEIIIAKCIGSESPGNGKIPNDISIMAIEICPEVTTTEYYIKGIHGSSDYIKRSGNFVIEGLSSNTYQIIRVCAVTGSFTMNLSVKGQI